jgi:type I restriction enzyme, S subunit
MKRYPAYKDSGVQWLGEVPEHWSQKRLKYLVRQVVNQRDFINEDERYVALEHIESWTGKLLPANGDVEFESLVKAFEPDDVLFCKLRPYLAKAIVASQKGVCVGELLVLRNLEETLPSYLRYCLLTRSVIDVINGSTYGAKMPRASWDFIGNLPFQIPTKPEQASIVSYLDRKNTEIDRFVQSKKRLIELLNEERAAFIQKVVLRGLNPDAAMRETGTMFAGAVPQHWMVRRAKFFFSEIDQRSENGDEELLSVSHITGVTPRSEKNVNMFLAESYEGSKVCAPGDLVINTMWAWMGAMGVSAHHGIISPSYAVYRQRSQYFLDTYLDLLSRTKPYIAEYTCRSTGIQESRMRMYPDQFFDIFVACPPIEEQRAIVAEIEEMSSRIDTTISRIEREIELLNEYRTALISEVVTGKIDVRNR